MLIKVNLIVFTKTSLQAVLHCPLLLEFAALKPWNQLLADAELTNEKEMRAAVVDTEKRMMNEVKVKVKLLVEIYSLDLSFYTSHPAEKESKEVSFASAIRQKR